MCDIKGGVEMATLVYEADKLATQPTPLHFISI